jgi:hypothetical protein
MTPRAAPTPIPAFAPVDRPPAGVFEAAGGEALDVDDAAAEIEDGVEMVVVERASELDDEEEVVSASPNTLAIVYLGSPLPSVQHAVELPQHHVGELAVISHGVTRTSWPAPSYAIH